MSRGGSEKSASAEFQCPASWGQKNPNVAAPISLRIPSRLLVVQRACAASALVLVRLVRRGRLRRVERWLIRAMAPTDRPAAGVTAASPGSAAAATTNPYELLVPQRALDNLKLYKYGAVDKSPLTKYIMKPYWDWAVTLFPMWMAYVHTCLGGRRARARARAGVAAAARVGEWAGLGRTGTGRGRGAGGARREIPMRRREGWGGKEEPTSCRC